MHPRANNSTNFHFVPLLFLLRVRTVFFFLGGGQGTSDPVVYVEAFGQKFATEVVKDRLNAVFDETFVISLRNMDMDTFNEGFFR